MFQIIIFAQLRQLKRCARCGPDCVRPVRRRFSASSSFTDVFPFVVVAHVVTKCVDESCVVLVAFPDFFGCFYLHFIGNFVVARVAQNSLNPILSQLSIESFQTFRILKHLVRTMVNR